MKQEKILLIQRADRIIKIGIDLAQGLGKNLIIPGWLVDSNDKALIRTIKKRLLLMHPQLVKSENLHKWRRFKRYQRIQAKIKTQTPRNKRRGINGRLPKLRKHY